MRYEIIGCAPEVKPQEGRVAITPAMAARLVMLGKDVCIGAGAGIKSGYPDSAYSDLGARIVNPSEVWDQSDLILQVKEPYGKQVEQIKSGRFKGKTLFTYLHLASSKELTQAMVEGDITGIAYETVTKPLANGSVDLPLLRPMSAIAGKRAIHIGAELLTNAQDGGKGIILGQTPDLFDTPGKVVVLGGGTVGYNAAYTAKQLEANVVLFEKNPQKISELRSDPELRGGVRIFNSVPEDVAHEVSDADLVIGAVNVRGAKAPVLLNSATIRQMQTGSVLVDVAIDQGGNFAGSKVTTHEDPTYLIDGKIFYCVSNMPGGVPRSSTHYLTAATMPYIERLVTQGLEALGQDLGFADGLNIYRHQVIEPEVAKQHGYSVAPNPFKS